MSHSNRNAWAQRARRIALLLLFSAVPRARGQIPAEERVVLAGSLPSKVRAGLDRGPVEPDAPMERMTLAMRLRPDAAERIAGLLARQQDPESPDYHQWLTPEDFGQQFGATEEALAQAIGWLEASGFQIDGVARGRAWINFSGSVAQVEDAFRTSIRRFEVGGRLHQSNTTEISLPRSIARIAHGVVSLNDFHSHPLHVRVPPPNVGADGGPGPLYTGSPCIHCLAPADFAKIYNAQPLYAAGVTGQGVKIAIVSRTNIHSSDVPLFRSTFGLPANALHIVINGVDPGVVNPGDEDEAELDAEWTGAVAPGAEIDLVVSKDTAASDGILASSQYIVDNNLAPVVNVSFGLCEKQIQPNPFESLWTQAALQGQTVLVASGDTGVAGCENANATTATQGASVNGICSTIASTCVGGTEFDDSVSPSSYWASTNDPTTKQSVLSYIPEEAWNENGSRCGALCSSGGGVSILYPKPVWQVAPGVPLDNHRYVPDVAIAASTRVPFLAFANGSPALTAFGGTSASAPAFSGIAALLVAKMGEPLGNINPRLYQLGDAQYGHGGPVVFHDATAGNNTVPGAMGFTSGPGYDVVTGLGSVDIDALAVNWPIPDAARMIPIRLLPDPHRTPRPVPTR